jgi:predicted DNA-binding protein
VAQVVEHLLCEHEDLSLKANTTKNLRKEGRKEGKKEAHARVTSRPGELESVVKFTITKYILI